MTTAHNAKMPGLLGQPGQHRPSSPSSPSKKPLCPQVEDCPICGAAANETWSCPLNDEDDLGDEWEEDHCLALNDADAVAAVDHIVAILGALSVPVRLRAMRMLLTTMTAIPAADSDAT